jgi:hypothetical protein
MKLYSYLALIFALVFSPFLTEKIAVYLTDTRIVSTL